MPTMKNPSSARLCASRPQTAIAATVALSLAFACGGSGGGAATTDDAGPEPPVGGGGEGGGGPLGGNAGENTGGQTGGAGGGAGGAGGAIAPLPTEPQVVTFTVADDTPTTPLGQIPFPSDLYRDAEGRLDLRGFPRPRSIALLETIVSEAETRTPGFAPSGTMYLNFGGTVPTGRLPEDGAASLLPDSALQLVNVDPASPHRGERIPLQWKVRETATDWLPANTLMVRCVEGRAMRGGTTYALVVTDAAGLVDPAFAGSLAADRPAGAAAGRAWDAHAPLRDYLADDPALAGKVAGAAVFTTQDPADELFRLYEHVKALPAPELVSIESLGIQQINKFELFDGVYRAPRFQEGNIPYQRPGEGALHVDAAGEFEATGMEDIRFSLSVPNKDAPETGWPVVMYGHGTGGDFHSYIGEKIANILTRNDVAVIAIDQIHHGTRDNGVCAGQADPQTCVELLFFNFFVPAAGRDNVRQSAIDYVSLHKFVQTLRINPNQSRAGNIVALDPTRIAYMGHSQGGLNGALYMAIERDIRGGMLSGAGAGLDMSVELKKAPVDLALPFAAVLGLKPDDPLERWHPTMMLVETFVAPGDPVNYAPYWFARPRDGYDPKSVFLTIGLNDLYTPPETNFALTAAGEVPVLEPIEAAIEGVQLLELPEAIAPVTGNVAGGRASAGLAQYADQGHFVIFDLPSAQQRYAKFLQSVLYDDLPTVF
jgi:pimeloyl-ACP methyl ester carboxylesterase